MKTTYVKSIAAVLLAVATSGTLRASEQILVNLTAPANGATVLTECAGSVALSANGTLKICSGENTNSPSMLRKVSRTTSSISCSFYPALRVEFYVNDVLVGTDTTPGPGNSFSVNYSFPSPGTYVIKARAFGNQGSQYSAPHTVTAVDPALNITSVSSSAFSFNIPYSAGTWTIYKSTDLINWTSAGSTVLSGGIASFTDDTISGVSYRFYKALRGDVCCMAAVGFSRTVAGAGGWTALANQFVQSPNTVSALFSPMVDGTSVPEGTLVCKWFGAGYDVYTRTSTGWSPHGNATFSPGEGIFCRNFTSNSFTVTFAGHVPQGTLTVPLPYPYHGYLSIISSKVPQRGRLTSDLGYATPLNGDTVYKWVFPEQQWICNWTYYAGDPEYPAGWYEMQNWTLEEPEYEVGESFFIAPAETNNWTRTFSPCP